MFNPAIHTATNKPIGLIGKPVDARSYFYDTTNFVYRAYVSTAEVLAYLDTASDRTGQFPIIINTGGSLTAGVITGGTNAEWWFKDGEADGNLVLKNAGGGGSVVMVPFTSVTTKTINWQTDIPPGFATTYAAIFGNMYPKPYVFNNTDDKMDFAVRVNRVTPGDITTDITTVVFDFGTATTGTIQF